MSKSIEVRLFEAMRKQSLEEELKYNETLRELIENNKVRNQDVWEKDESEKTEYCLERLNEKIESLKEDLKD